MNAAAWRCGLLMAVLLIGAGAACTPSGPRVEPVPGRYEGDLRVRFLVDADGNIQNFRIDIPTAEGSCSLSSSREISVLDNGVFLVGEGIRGQFTSPTTVSGSYGETMDCLDLTLGRLEETDTAGDGTWQASLVEAADPAAATAAARTPAPAPSSIADPSCEPAERKAAAEAINERQLEFDRASGATAEASIEQVDGHILALQELRDAARAEQAANCVKELWELQIAHMDAVIVTLVRFRDGANKSTLEDSLRTVQKLHDAYVEELARLMETAP